MATLLFEFDDFPAERDAIGRMVVAYGEIEFSLLTCLSAVLGDKEMDTAVRILFRVRGEAARIEVADAIIRPAFIKAGFGGKWTNAYGAARICKNIRNQYAHCHWLPRGKAMTFMDLDTDSRQPEGEIKLTAKAVTAELLETQKRYFEYCLDLLWFLESEYRKKIGLPPTHEASEPKPMDAPRLFIPFAEAFSPPKDGNQKPV